ncbi:MAG: anion-transporting ATPase [Proteobacteria bacterium]|nr:MAG: anion-transporting ATPase [Pseudomonadota bacterium]
MLNRRLIIIGGKGGVGRTTISCALGLALAQRGRRVLLAHVRAERLEQQLCRLLGTKRVDEKIRAVTDSLWVVNMNPRAAIREMGLMVLRFRAVYRAVLENRIVRSFLRAVPALDDYSMIGKTWYHTTELDRSGVPRFDTVVFDGPATGHLISMLRIPQVILDSVPEGPLTADAKKARTLLSDPVETAMLIVTVAEEMPASEAVDLFRAATGELDIAVERLVINQLYPDEFRREPELAHAIETLAASHQPEDQLFPMVASAETFRRRQAINQQYLQKLELAIPRPQLRVPHLFSPDLDREHLQPVVDAFDAVLEEYQP